MGRHSTLGELRGHSHRRILLHWRSHSPRHRIWSTYCLARLLVGLDLHSLQLESWIAVDVFVHVVAEAWVFVSPVRGTPFQSVSL